MKRVWIGAAVLVASCAQQPPVRSVPPKKASPDAPAARQLPPPTQSGDYSVAPSLGAGSGDGAAAAYRNVKDSADHEGMFTAARDRIQAGDSREGSRLLDEYLAKAPQGEHADEARFYLGRQALGINDFDAASRQFESVLRMQPPSKLRGQSLYLKAFALSRMGRDTEALNYLGQLNPQEIPQNQKLALFQFWGATALNQGRNLESTLAYVKAWRLVEEPETKRSLENSIQDQIQNRLSEAELNYISTQYPREYPVSLVDLRLATLHLAAGRRDEARVLLTRVVDREPTDSPLKKKAQDLMGRVSAPAGVDSGKIGVLVGLSGDHEGLGRSVVEGFTQALKENGSNIEVVAADAGKTADSARIAFERLVREDRVLAVVGPLAGNQAEAVAKKAAEWGVPNISLSPRSHLVETGPEVFRVALTPEKQVQALVGYAREKLNAKRFAIIFPRDNFGREFASAYFKAVEAWGGSVTAAESYDPRQSDFKAALQNMTGQAFPSFRKTEAEDKIKLAETKVQRKLTRREAEAEGLAPIVDFDVIFIPDTFRAVGQIAPALLYADVSTPKLMGPSTWRNKSLLMRAGQYLENALFVDIFAPERQDSRTKTYVTKYVEEKGSSPGAMSAVGYDVGLAMALALRKGEVSSREELRSRLENLGDVAGTCGLYRWDSRREPLAELQLFTVRRAAFLHQGGVLVRDKASEM